MIARVSFWLILMIVLPDIYIYLHYFIKRYKISVFQKILWWMPCLGMVVYTIGMASVRNFAPADLTWLNTYLFLLGMFVGPKLFFAIFSSIGTVLRKYVFHSKHNWGHWIGLVAGFIAFALYVEGLTVGFSKVRVRHVDLYYTSLPKAFDGYKIVHTSDMHVGTFKGWRKFILEAEIDSIRAQAGSNTIFCFTGDMQNMRPEELEEMMPVVKRMPKTFFVLGNHDYAEYVKREKGLEERMYKQLLSLESKLGKPLCNENFALTAADGSKIYLVGTENDGTKRFISRADYKKAMKNVPKDAFVIMLQHDPSMWEQNVLPQTNAQLTLSGHTHGGQIQIFGWRPTKGKGYGDYGLFRKNGNYLNVTAGLGGFVPFRFNRPNEICVITLHKGDKQPTIN